jgi:hypothetical protein
MVKEIKSLLMPLVKIQNFLHSIERMQAYETALIGGETSLILSPDSEFFKFFGNIKPEYQ